MKVLDLFAGIGGFSLGLERAGMTTAAFCEIEPYCQAVLRKHWPGVPIYDDIRTLSRARLARDGIIDELADTSETRLHSKRQRDTRPGWKEGRASERGIDVICGGFPCQDISTAGKGAGIEGERSGLWSEYARLIGELRPRYAIVENVAALLGRGLERVLGDLAALGYDAEWHCIPASAVGAPHRRDRVWVLAYPSTARLPLSRTQPHGAYRQQIRRLLTADSWWAIEPSVGRVAHGIPARVDRLKALGNAVVPQIPEIIGKAIMECA